MTEENRFLKHPSYPYKLEKRGQEFIRHYPEGAEAISTAEEWLLLSLLIRLDEALDVDITVSIPPELPLKQAIAAIEKEVAVVETKRGRKAK